MKQLIATAILTLTLASTLTARSVDFLGINVANQVANSSNEAEQEATNYYGHPLNDHHHFNQYEVCPDNRNACGTTSLSMVLANEGLMVHELRNATELDERVRPWGGFTAPNDIVKEAKKQGLKCSAINEASFAKLIRCLKAGNSVIALIEGGKSPHWIVVLGVEINEATDEKTVYIACPGDDTYETLTKAEFKTKWKTPNAGMAGNFVNDVLGYSKYMIALDRDKDNLPKSDDFEITATDTLADGVTDLGATWNSLGDLDFPEAIGQGLAASIKINTAIPGVVGSALENAELGSSPLAVGVNALGSFYSGVGNVMSSFGNSVGNAYEMGGEVLGDIVDGFGSFIGGFLN